MTTVLIIIGYLIVGMLVFGIEKNQDKYIYRRLQEVSKEEVENAYGIQTNTNAYEYYRKTNWIPKEITSCKLIVGCVLAAIIWILWPISAIVSPIWNWVVFKQIMRRNEMLV